MDYKKASILIIFIASASSLAEVQSSADDTLLSLNRLIELAIENGTTPQLSKNQIKQQQINVQSANSEFLPEVRSGVSASASRTENDSWNGSNSISAGVSYSFSPSSIHNVKSTEKKRASSELAYQQTIDGVMADAIITYINAVYTLKKIEIAVNNNNYQKLKLQQIEEFRNAGKRSLSDVLQQQTITVESEAALLQVKLGYDRAMLSLFSTASLPLDSRMVPDTNVLPALMSTAALIDSALVPALDLNVIAQYQAKKRDLEAAELTFKSVKAAYIPSISGSLNSGTDYASPGGFSEPDLRASVNISYPIFDRFSRKLRVQSAQLSLDNLYLQLTELEKSIKLEYQYSCSDLEMAWKQFDVAKVRLLSARDALDAVMARYESGMSTLLETTLANNSYLDALDSRLKAEISILNSYISLLRVNGSIQSFVEKIAN